MDWTSQTEELIDGCARFLDRVYRLVHDDSLHVRAESDDSDLDVRRAVHRTITKVTDDLERWSYNTAVAALMELLNTLSKWARGPLGAERRTLDEALDVMLLLLAPMAPHLSAELWQTRHPDQPSVHRQAWPEADPELVRAQSITMVVQVNGKVRARLEVEPAISEEQAVRAALADPAIQGALDGQTASRVVARPPRLVNVIV